jgi:hypothetical protein
VQYSFGPQTVGHFGSGPVLVSVQVEPVGFLEHPSVIVTDFVRKAQFAIQASNLLGLSPSAIVFSVTPIHPEPLCDQFQ